MSSTKIISLLLSFLFISSLLFIPVSAAEAEPPKEYKQVDGFFQWLARQGSGITEWLGLSTWSTEFYCAKSEDNRHYSTDYQFVEGVGDVETGYYYCICDYCGCYFRAYEQDVKQSYDNYVAGLDESLVSNDGSIYLKFQDQTTSLNGSPDNYSFTKEKKHITEDKETYYYYRDDYHYYLSGLSKGEVKYYRYFTYDQYNNLNVNIRNEGFYQLKFINLFVPQKYYPSGITNITIYNSEGKSIYQKQLDGSSYKPNGDIFQYNFNFYFDKGSYKIVIKPDGTFYHKNFVSYQYFDCVWGPFSLVPVNELIDIPSNTESRIGSIYGDYGITGENGTIIHSEDNYIFDETNNTYNNPYNDTSKTVKNWSYDYSKREYNLTFDDGSTATVTYGDENVTINENNTVYNVYYMGADEASDHIHAYNEEVISAPTCTLAGQSKYTCGICEKTYTQDKPALGHKWTTKQTVQTQYGENGELLQQGYTIYKCSTCGEEYKAESGAAPPGGSGGGSSGTGDGDQSGEGGGQSWLDKLGEFVGGTLGKLISLIGSVISGILDGLISLVTDVINSLGGVVELFGSFGPAMGNLWSWLPSEIVTVMVAGVSIIVLVSVVKAFI